MTAEEISNEFDILYNNIFSNQAPGLDEYEKSVFLTKAQNEILKFYFEPQLNKSQNGFDEGTKRQIEFSSIVILKDLQPTLSSPISGVDSLGTSDSFIVEMPEDVLFILNETAVVQNRFTIVVPITYSEYMKLMAKPFKKPLKSQAWRVITQGSNDKIEVIFYNDTATPLVISDISKYIIRYVKKPYPIILENISPLTIEGFSTPLSPLSVCELDEGLQQEVIQRAVELAKASYEGNLVNALALGNSSETNAGIVPREAQSRQR